MAARVLLLTRSGCHLCHDARALVERESAAAGVDWAEQDVDSDPELLAAYSDLVPVVLVDGTKVGHWRIAPGTVHKALNPEAVPRRRFPWARRKR